MDPIKPSIFNPPKIIPIIPKRPEKEKLKEVIDKTTKILTDNGFTNPNVKEYGYIVVWVNEEEHKDVQKIKDLLKENGAVEDSKNGSFRFKDFEDVEVVVSINSKKHIYSS